MQAPTQERAMSFLWIIDGYNLMGALGLLAGKLPANGLQEGRQYLLDFLADSFQDNAYTVLVIFDAAHPPRRYSAEQEHRGIQVRFAKGQPEADDLIEDLIKAHPQPKKVTIVSSDHRLQRAARRREERVLTCEAFLDTLEAGNRHAASNLSTDVNDKPGLDDATYWLGVFKDLEKDPRFRDLFDDMGTDGLK